MLRHQCLNISNRPHAFGRANLTNLSIERRLLVEKLLQGCHVLFSFDVATDCAIVAQLYARPRQALNGTSRAAIARPRRRPTELPDLQLELVDVDQVLAGGAPGQAHRRRPQRALQRKISVDLVVDASPRCAPRSRGGTSDHRTNKRTRRNNSGDG